MASKTQTPTLFLIIASITLLFPTSQALIPYARSHWDPTFPLDDPFRILEQSPLNILPRNMDLPALLARADWRETAAEHVIVVDVPGMKKEDVKVEVEENRVVRISGERKEEKEVEVEGEKWHRAERTSGKFLRQFRMPANADLDKISAKIEDGVLRIVVPKFKEEVKRQPKVISILGDQIDSAEDVKTTKASV